MAIFGHSQRSYSMLKNQNYSFNIYAQLNSFAIQTSNVNYPDSGKEPVSCYRIYKNTHNHIHVVNELDCKGLQWKGNEGQKKVLLWWQKLWLYQLRNLPILVFRNVSTPYSNECKARSSIHIKSIHHKSTKGRSQG